MKCIILAAGRGSRLGHLTNDVPKCLLELGSITLLQRQINVLYEAGITEIGIVTGYQSDKLQEYSIKKFHNARWNKTNMVSSLIEAKEWLETSTCIVSYSDIFYGPEAINALVRSGNDLSITYDPHWLNHWKLRFDEPLDDAETFTHRDGKLIEIGRKTRSLAEIDGQYMGLIKFSPRSWLNISRYLQTVEQSKIDNLQLTHLLNILVENRIQDIEVIPYEGIWGEIDNQRDLSLYGNLYFPSI
jgi:choline kinase